MSYSFGMFFKEINATEILPFFNKACEVMIRHDTEVLESQKYYIPSIRENKMNNYADKYWLDTVFSLPFIYWEEYNLLGLSGYNYPKELTDLFDCHVCFQNSSDRDYEYDVWSDNISLFKQAKEKSRDLSVEGVLKWYYEKEVDWHTQEEIQENFEYHKKTILYDMLFKELALYDWLYGRKNPCFKRYTINSIDCSERKDAIYFKLKNLVKKLEQDMMDIHVPNIGDTVYWKDCDGDIIEHTYIGCIGDIGIVSGVLTPRDYSGKYPKGSFPMIDCNIRETIEKISEQNETYHPYPVCFVKMKKLYQSKRDAENAQQM